jgi:predicted dehydrogenase
MSISLTPFERQFEDFAEAIRASRQPLVDGFEGYRALATVLSIYESCRENKPIRVFPDK